MAETITPDLCVIGAGRAGLVAALDAAALGASVVLVEQGRLGGVDLNAGTLPSRALAAAAARAQAMREAAPFGIAPEEPRINTRRVYDHVARVMASLAPRDAAARLEALGVRVIAATGRFSDDRTLLAGEVAVRARRFIIATGARTAVPPIRGLDAVPYFTTETIFDNTRKLSHLVIVGGGALGVELAQSYRRLGSMVTLIEHGGVLKDVDPDLAEVALERLRAEGVDLRQGAELIELQPRSQGIGAVVRTAGGETVLDVSHVLVARERMPLIGPLEIDKAGILPQQGDPRFLRLDANLRTTNRRVYLVGDAAGGEGYGHVGAEQARLAVRHALLGLPVRLRTEQLPRVVFTDPEIAVIGLDEAAARRQAGDRCVILRASFADNDRARAMRATAGVVKLIATREGRILGAGVVGDRAGELAALLAFGMQTGVDIDGFARFVPPHPSHAELLRELAAEHARLTGGNPLLRRLASLVRLLP